MSLFLRLTSSQASIIQTITRWLEKAPGCRVAFLGIDANDLPVIQFKDLRRTTEPFAIPRETYYVGAVEPTPPLRWFTEYEADHVDPRSHEILTELYSSVK